MRLGFPSGDSVMAKRKSTGKAKGMTTARGYASPPCYQHELDEAESESPRVKIKRVYLAASPFDGARVLIDGLWPRGLSRERANVDEWMRELAPSPQLRRWFAHDPARWSEFRRRYRAELRAAPQALKTLRERLRTGPVTLLYAARDVRFNHARVLLELLQTPEAGSSVE
jgi:uncharacterized protein YeaO (DUF488 family)